MADYKGIKGFTVQSLATDPSTPGAVWSSGGALNTARRSLAGTGTNSSALGFGGNPSVTGAATEEWSIPGTITKTLTTT